MMVKLKELIDKLPESDTDKIIELFEREVYKNIPGTKSSFRQDSGNTNTMTLKHAHVYAKSNGRGKQLYSVSIDGSAHDGFSGATIPDSHADFFRSQGYEIKPGNILESLEIININPGLKGSVTNRNNWRYHLSPTPLIMEDMDLVVSRSRREIGPDPASPNIPHARVKSLTNGSS